MSWEPVIGLEVHVQLRTATKIFCRCRNLFGAPPNSLICPVCLGYPGSLPVLNTVAVDLAVKLATALHCEVRPQSVFARKNYFYADLPKGYQISQFDRPVAENGFIPLASSDRRIGILRLHLEEDAGKLLHETPGGGSLPGKSLVDFNRCGVPLVEIVSLPEITSAAEAQEYLQTLHQVLRYTATSDGNMEEGSLRCDANVSIRPSGSEALGTKVEIKNLNSFRNVARSIEYEIERQAGVLESGGAIEQETRTFDAAQGVTRVLRSKEEAHDYRYFPEPDLPVLVLEESRRESLQHALPEMPWDRRERFAREYELSLDDARLLTSSRELADYLEAALEGYEGTPRTVANWIKTEILRELKERHAEVGDAIAPARLTRLVGLVDDGELSSLAAKEVLAAIWETGEEPGAAMERLGLVQVRDAGEIDTWVAEALSSNPKAVEEYLGGRSQALGFLVGQVMKLSAGRADPRRVQTALRGRLEEEQAEVLSP